MAVGGTQAIASSIYFEAQPFTFSSQDTDFDKMESFGFQGVYYPTNYSQMPDKSIELMDEKETAGTFKAFSNFCSVLVLPQPSTEMTPYDYLDLTNSPYSKPFIVNISREQKFNKTFGQHDIRNYRSYAASAFYGNLDLK